MKKRFCRLFQLILEPILWQINSENTFLFQISPKIEFWKKMSFMLHHARLHSSCRRKCEEVRRENTNVQILIDGSSRFRLVHHNIMILTASPIGFSLHHSFCTALLFVDLSRWHVTGFFSCYNEFIRTHLSLAAWTSNRWASFVDVLKTVYFILQNSRRTQTFS